jgi:hypothetical protein
VCLACKIQGVHGICNGLGVLDPFPEPVLTRREFLALVRAAAGLNLWSARYATASKGGYVWVEWSVGIRQVYVSLSEEGEIRIERRVGSDGALSERLSVDELPESIRAALAWMVEGLDGDGA